MQKKILNKQQVYLITGSIILLASLTFFDKTVNPKKTPDTPKNEIKESTFKFNDVLNKAKSTLDSNLLKKINALEKDVLNASNSDKIHYLSQLALAWKNEAQIIEPYLFYNGEAAKLVNSEKTLTFAAHQYIEKLLVLDNADVQNWLASQAKVLFDKALILNPNNDSSKIGLGACYILGNISNNPMTGILPVREICNKQPNNLFAHYILGVGGLKSTQFNKAIEHFKILHNSNTKNVEYTLYLAECYERMQDKTNAILFYNKSKELIENKSIKQEIEERIKQIK